MATVQIYDQINDKKYSVTVDTSQAVISDSLTGEVAFYIWLTTNAKDPSGTAIPMRVLTDADIGLSDFTTYITAKMVEILVAIQGGYLSSSSLDSSVSSASSSSDSSNSSSSQSVSESSISSSDSSESSQSQSSKSESSRSESSKSESSKNSTTSLSTTSISSDSSTSMYSSLTA